MCASSKKMTGIFFSGGGTAFSSLMSASTGARSLRRKPHLRRGFGGGASCSTRVDSDDCAEWRCSVDGFESSDLRLEASSLGGSNSQYFRSELCGVGSG